MVTLKQSLQEEIPFKKFGRVYTSKKKKKRNKFDSDVYTRPNEQGDIGGFSGLSHPHCSSIHACMLEIS